MASTTGEAAMRVDLGEMSLQRVVEQEIPYSDPLSFFPGLTADRLAENRPWMTPRALDPATGHVVLSIQSYIVRTPHHVILIDSCVGNHKNLPNLPFWHRRDDPAYMRSLAAAGLTVDDIDLVLCTHLHVDHVGWNTKLENGQWVPTFPKARYVFAEQELAYWTAENAKEPIGPMVDSVLPIVAAQRADVVRSDHVLNEHVRLMPTPGHTPDHFSVGLGKGQDAAVVTGDLIHSPLQARYPELPCFADGDPALASVTRRRFLERYCDTDTLICPGHFPSPSCGHVTRWGDGFRFVPVD
jgi:glyoxylase-like metal-dependent hydrolase (beta-lactamase superfamily II)